MINEKTLNDDQLKKVLELLKDCKDYTTFQYENLIIAGNKALVVKDYIILNPSKKFRIWLIDSGLVIKEL